ncbi:MAG: lipopolysaccharide heptosyltransferase II [Planctomycetes bacterium]|nr:lipopolysaccharide heptosyltransferase II [Planctomycetota bacterium]
MRQADRIYVRAPNWVGDFVMATGAFARLRRAYPRAQITVAMRPYLRGLLSGSDWFDDVIEVPRSASWSAVRAQVAALRAARCELAVVMPNSFVTALVPWLAGVPRRFGYRQGRGLLLSGGPVAARGRRFFWQHGPRRIPVPMPGYYARLLDALDLPPGEERPRLHLDAADRDLVEAWLAARGVAAGTRLILMTAGASYGASKLWAPERFAALARRLVAAKDRRVVVLAGPAELELARTITELAGGPAAGVHAAIDPVLPLGGLKALCQRASLMVTADTGPRHVAVAFDVPVVCLMGPTDSRYTDYALERQTVIQRRELPCVPCQRKVCPLGHHECMKSIGVDEVAQAAEQWLGP